MLGVEQPAADHFAMYGLSDEQYKVKGGNEQIVQLLGQRLSRPSYAQTHLRGNFDEWATI